MEQKIKTIRPGGVNCYLLKAGSGYVLIDTGVSSGYSLLKKELDNAGATPENLRLILLTHGDSDHAGNCALLREKYGVKIAMHSGDLGMAVHGDMSWNRKIKPDRMSLIFKAISFIFGKLAGQPHFETFTPDILIEDGQSLSKYGLAATVLHLPGHSKGSIGILTQDGNLFCGDLIYNMPGFFFIDDLADHRASMEKLKSHRIDTVYPGHGKPFLMSLYRK
jgi:glyoxylase-like metal-dependent hydrolase (beta-lactamase superfamily II)